MEKLQDHAISHGETVELPEYETADSVFHCLRISE